MVYNEQIRISLYNGEWFLGDDLNWETVTDKFFVGLTVPIPTAKKHEIDVPGRHGKLDLTDALGGVKYDNRLCKLKLVAKEATTEAEIDAFIRTFNGKRCALDVQKDGYKLIGRLAVLSKKENKAERILLCEFDAEPLKIKNDAINAEISPVYLPDIAAVWTILDSSGATGANITTIENEYLISYNHAYTSNSDFSKNAELVLETNLSETKALLEINTYLYTASSEPNIKFVDSRYIHWSITDDAGNVLAENSGTEHKLAKMLINDNGIGNLHLNISSIANAVLAENYEYTLYITLEKVDTLYSRTFTNNGEETIARYNSPNPAGSFEIWLNDACVLNKKTENGEYVSDPRLLVKHGENLVFFRNHADGPVAGSNGFFSYRECEL